MAKQAKKSPKLVVKQRRATTFWGAGDAIDGKLPPGVYDMKVVDVKPKAFGLGFDISYEMMQDGQDREAHAVLSEAGWKQAYNLPQRRFADLLAPDLKSVFMDTLLKEESQMSEYISRTFFVPAKKKLTPRTTREKSLVAQAVEAARREGFEEGHKQGLATGRDQERQRGEKLLASLIEAQARGFARNS